MGKRHRAQDPANKSHDFLSSAIPSSPVSAAGIIHKKLPDAASHGKGDGVKSAKGAGAKSQGLPSNPIGKKAKKEMKKSMSNSEGLGATTDSKPSSGEIRKSDPLRTHAFQNSSKGLDGQDTKKNGVKRKAGKMLEDKSAKTDGHVVKEELNNKLVIKKKKKLRGASDKSSSKREDNGTSQLPSDAQVSGSSPMSMEVVSPSEKGAAAEPVGLDIYWKLSSTDADVRELASMALVRELQVAQEAYEATGEDNQKGAEQVLLGAATDSDGLEGCAPGVRYALRRLVRGVASSHESARQGFALALTMVLGVLPCVKGVAIMRIIEKNLEVTSSARGQEAREGFLGRLFAYGAMVRSRRLFSDVNGSDKELTKEVTEQLLNLAQKKSFLREPAICVLLELANQLPLDSLENSICAAPTFKEWIKVGPESGGADVLFLAVKLWQKLPAAISKACPLLPKSGNFFELFDAHHILAILPYLEEASISHPRVHSVWPVLFQVLLPDNVDATLGSLHVEDQKKKQKHRKAKENTVLDSALSREALARFWRVLVDEHLLISSHARKHLALNLLMLVLPRLPTAFIGIVLSNTFVRCLLDVLASKDTLLFNCVQLCIQELCKWAEKDDKHIIGVVISLQQGSLGKFDAISKTHTVKSLISRITSQVDLESLIHRLENMFCEDISTHLKAEADSSGRSSNSEVVTLKLGENRAEGRENSIGERNNIANRLWILDLMCSLCKQAQFDFAKKVALQIEVGKFLFCQVIFDSGDLGKVAPQKLRKVVKWSLQPMPKLLKDRCISRLLSLLVENQQLLVAHKGNRKRFGELEESSGEIEDMGLCLFEFYQELKKLLSVPVATTSTQKEAEIVLKLTTAISEISLAVATVDGECCEKLRAMRSLLVQMVLQSCLEPAWDIEIASELLICCKHAFGDLLRLNLGEIEENLSETPPVIEVMVELIISLLSKPSAPLRSAAEQVFKCFSGDVTVSSLRGMLQVIKKQPLTARHKVNNPLDEDNDDDPLGLEEDESEDDDEKGSFSDIDKNEDSSEDLLLEEFSELGTGSQEAIDKSTNSYKKVNVDANKNVHQKNLQDGTDPDDSELSDLDDDAMFRIDAHLAQIFKQKKKGIVDGNVELKDAETQLLHLKFRLLALLEIFLQKHSTSPLVLIIVPSLLQAFVVASTTGSTQLADRVASILQNKVFKAKHYVKASDIDFGTVKDILDRAWKLASRSANKKVGSLAQACWIWILKVIHGTFAAEADRDILEVVSAALEDYFNQKKSRLSTSFFVDTLMRHNWIGKLLIGRLMEKCITARSEFLQCEAMRLAAIVLGSKSRISREPAAVLDDGWRHLAGPLLPYLERIDNMMLTVFQKPFGKASRQTEAVQFCIVCCEVFPLLYSQTLAELINVGPLLSATKNFKAPVKGKLQSLVSKFQHCLEAGPLPSSSVSVKAVNANGYLGESTQTKVLPPSERLEPLAKPKKKKKKLELNV